MIGFECIKTTQVHIYTSIHVQIPSHKKTKLFSSLLTYHMWLELGVGVGVDSRHYFVFNNFCTFTISISATMLRTLSCYNDMWIILLHRLVIIWIGFVCIFRMSINSRLLMSHIPFLNFFVVFGLFFFLFLY